MTKNAGLNVSAGCSGASRCGRRPPRHVSTVHQHQYNSNRALCVVCSVLAFSGVSFLPSCLPCLVASLLYLNFQVFLITHGSSSSVVRCSSAGRDGAAPLSTCRCPPIMIDGKSGRVYTHPVLAMEQAYACVCLCVHASAEPFRATCLAEFNFRPFVLHVILRCVCSSREPPPPPPGPAPRAPGGSPRVRP